MHPINQLTGTLTVLHDYTVLITVQPSSNLVRADATLAALSKVHNEHSRVMRIEFGRQVVSGGRGKLVFSDIYVTPISKSST